MNLYASSAACLMNQDFLLALLHLVERPGSWHAGVDLALWRGGRRGRVRQSLLPHQGRQDRSDARLRAALVIYNGYRRGSMIRAWHGTAGFTTVDMPRRRRKCTPRCPGRSRTAKPTGTPAAARARPARRSRRRRPKATGDYKAWVPGAKQLARLCAVLRPAFARRIPRV